MASSGAAAISRSASAKSSALPARKNRTSREEKCSRIACRSARHDGHAEPGVLEELRWDCRLVSLLREVADHSRGRKADAFEYLVMRKETAAQIDPIGDPKFPRTDTHLLQRVPVAVEFDLQVRVVLRNLRRRLNQQFQPIVRRDCAVVDDAKAVCPTLRRGSRQARGARRGCCAQS